jgi:hypothetical protein
MYEMEKKPCWTHNAMWFENVENNGSLNLKFVKKDFKYNQK